VFAEKNPLLLILSQIEALCPLARKKACVLWFIQNRALMANFLASLKALIESGELGELKHIDLALIVSARTSQGVGVKNLGWERGFLGSRHRIY